MANHAQSETVLRRYRAFVKEYLANGFNGTKAYMSVYKDVSYEVAGVEACRLLNDPRVKDILAEYNSDIVSEEEILVVLKDRMKQAEKDGDKIRSAEILAKIKKMMSDSQTNVNVFTEDNSLRDSILERRRQAFDN